MHLNSIVSLIRLIKFYWKVLSQTDMKIGSLFNWKTCFQCEGMSSNASQIKFWNGFTNSLNFYQTLYWNLIFFNEITLYMDIIWLNVPPKGVHNLPPFLSWFGPYRTFFGQHSNQIFRQYLIRFLNWLTSFASQPLTYTSELR